MGCFLGCFSLSSGKKRRKPTRKILPGEHRICSYEPLLSSDLSNPEKISNSNLRCEVEEKRETKTRKRVRFNLNVQTYEPIPRTYEDACSGDDDDDRRRAEIYAPKAKPKDLGMKTSYPSNYRYQNCADSYDEEDESDMDDGDYYTDDDEEIDYQDDEDEVEQEKQKLEVLDSTMDARDRNQYVTQVLNPVQNLAQWKAVKRKPVKQPMKENFKAAKLDQVKPLLQEIAIDASLSNWLASPKKEMLIGEILYS